MRFSRLAVFGLGLALCASAGAHEYSNKGVTVDLIQGDSGDTDNKAYETEIPRLLGEGATAIIGAASSGTPSVTLSRTCL